MSREFEIYTREDELADERDFEAGRGRELAALVSSLTAQLAQVTAERDNARRDAGTMRDMAIAVRVAERDTAIAERDQARAERDAAREEIRTTMLADEERRKLTGDALHAEALLAKYTAVVEAAKAWCELDAKQNEVALINALANLGDTETPE